MRTQAVCLVGVHPMMARIGTGSHALLTATCAHCSLHPCRRTLPAVCARARAHVQMDRRTRKKACCAAGASGMAVGTSWAVCSACCRERQGLVCSSQRQAQVKSIDEAFDRAQRCEELWKNSSLLRSEITMLCVDDGSLDSYAAIPRGDYVGTRCRDVHETSAPETAQ